MTNCKDLLAKELSILYPDVTDIELNEMTNNLIDFYITAVKVVLKDDKAHLFTYKNNLIMHCSHISTSLTIFLILLMNCFMHPPVYPVDLHDQLFVLHLRLILFLS